MTASSPTVRLLADCPERAGTLALMQWQEWANHEKEPLERWIDIVERDCSRTSTPIGFVALDGDELVGGASLRPFDIPQRRDRSPWVCGMIVHPDRRGSGIGALLMEKLHLWAAGAGISEAWVWTDLAAGFYEKCEWTIQGKLINEGVEGTVLRKLFRGGGT